MRRLLLYSVVVGVLVAHFSFGESVTSTQTCDVRTLPSATARIRAKLNGGTEVELLGHTKRQGSFHIRMANGMTGWVASKCIEPQPIPINALAASAPTNVSLANHSAALKHLATTDRAHQLAVKASQVSTNTCANITDSQSCHSSFAEGCTNSTKPNTYDAFLNFLKNQILSPTTAAQEVTADLTSLSDFQQKDNSTEKLGLGKQRQAEFADDLAGLGQGNIVRVMGYLYYAIPGGVETCNCKLANPNDKDYHVGIGFDPQTAAEIANGTIAPSATDPDPLKQSSIIVEMTPHYRAKYHPSWTLPGLQEIAGHQVRIVGQLTVDNEHNEPAQNCAFSSRNIQTCWRASVWEIHPVTSFSVCKNDSQPCRIDHDEDWTDF